MLFYAQRAKRLSKTQTQLFLLLTLVVPFLASALLVNLKRGPWAGALVGGLALLFFVSRKNMVRFLIVVGIAFFALQPIRTRLANSYNDFFIAGGRSVIWDIGVDLSARFPLGIGFGNSEILRAYSDEIPPELRHFHNNLLNILVECGWLGVMAFLYWLLVFVVDRICSTRQTRSGIGSAYRSYWLCFPCLASGWHRRVQLRRQ